MTELKDRTILVLGIGETASAVARRLFAEGYAVALFRSTAPRMLRRRRNFSDAWYDGFAHLEGIETRRVDTGAEFLLGIRTRGFIPLLRNRVPDLLERWPWDVVVASDEENEPLTPNLRNYVDFTIGLGSGFRAGADVDIVVETGGADPGAIIKDGSAKACQRAEQALSANGHALVPAPRDGQFFSNADIGDFVQAGALLGFVGTVILTAPHSGRIIGARRSGQAVTASEPVIEIARSKTLQPAGINRRDLLISSGVVFAIETEFSGAPLTPFETWFSN